MFAFTDCRGQVEAAFTDRHGGVSGGPYASLNLAVNGDESDAVARNLQLVTDAVAAGLPGCDGEPVRRPHERVTPRLALMRQVHGSSVVVVRGQPAPDPPEADVLVTADPGVLLMVRVADCVPVLLADVERRVVGAAHAGRQGLSSGVVPAAVTAMRSLGADELVAWVGPHVCGSCYEVPAQMREEVAAVVPESFAETSWGTPALDVGAGVTAQLRAEGVSVVDASRCTVEDAALYSYRRQGVESGRSAGVVWVRP